MRDFLTGLAIVLIVVLTTLLVAPYFVDWNGQRGFLETQLSRALGQTVTIGGNIDLKLLPTPYLRLNQTVIGSDDGSVRIGIRHLDLELSVAPLLHGEFDIVEGRLDGPTIRVTLQMDRNLPGLPDTPALRANIRLERVRIVDGTLAIADPQSGHTLVVDHLDFNAEAPSLTGPYKGNGTQGLGGGRTKFRFSTTTPNGGKTHVHLVLDETSKHPALDLDGDVALNRVADAGIRQSFAGKFTASGHVIGAADLSIGWKLTGPLKADPQRASFADGELRVGSEDDALTLQAAGDAAFGDASDLHLKLAAQQLDIDRLSGAPVNQTRPPPPKLPALSALKQLLEAVTPPLPTFVDVSVDTATWGGESLGGLAAHLALGGPAPRPIRLSGEGPGGLHLDVRGELADTGRFGGNANLSADDLPVALRWLAAVTTASVPRELPFRSMSLASRVATETNSLDLTDLTLSLDRSKFNGTARIASGDRTKISADLITAALDLDTLPSLGAIEKRSAPFDIALALDAGALKIAHAGNGPLDAGHVRLDADIEGLRVTIRDFAAEDLGGATVRGSGSADETAATMAITMDAARLADAAALSRQLLPGALTDAFAARAPDLAPAKLKIGASFAALSGRSGLAPSRLDIAGTMAETHLDLHLAPDPNSDDVILTAKADAAHARTLLGQLGLPTLPLDIVGASRVTLSASGRRDQPLATKIDALFGGTHLTADGSFDLLTGIGRGGSGTVTLASADAGPLLQALAILPFDSTDQLPVDLSAGLGIGETGLAISDLKGRVDAVGVHGALKWQTPSGDAPALTGSLNLDRLTLGGLLSAALGPSKTSGPEAVLSSEPFASGLPAPPRTAITLHADTLDLGLGLHATQASAEIALAPNTLTLKHGAAQLAGGELHGDISVRRDGPQAFLEGSIVVAKAALDIAPIKSRLDGKLDFAGGGQSQFALTNSLAGTGQVTLSDTVVGGVNAHALPAALAATEDDTLSVDDESIRRALEVSAPGSLDFGTRHFATGLAGGTLTLTAQDRQSAVAGAVDATLGGNFDMRRPQLTIRVDETLNALPKGWTGPAPSITVQQTVAPGSPPKRTFDVSAFTNAVAARAIARESARIESYEFDIRERALFNARLEADRRREQDRLKVEADAKAAMEAARKAEADRKAKVEAARLERQREERDARERDIGASPALPRSDPAQRAPERFDAPAPGATADPSGAGRY